MDDFGSWDYGSVYGKVAVLSKYTRESEKKAQRSMTAEEYETIYDNMMQNVVSIVAENPNTDFYLFFPPVSIVGMGSYNNNGELEAIFDTQKYAYELLLEYENAKVFAWANEYEMMCELNNFKDPWHYSGEINSKMLSWMKDDYGLLTQDNYKHYFAECRDFYESYDYDSIFQ